MIRRFLSLCVLVAIGAALVLAGCAKKKLLAVENLAPETSLFVQGSLDTVNHIVQIYWFGSDPDGEVSGFELRFKNPASPLDTAWVFTTRTDSLFTVHIPSGYEAPRFEVRSVDNTGTRDASPAYADFQFNNQAPTVSFDPRLLPTDTTYASLTVTWKADDPDGKRRMIFQIGLDTIPSALHLVTGNTFTIDTSDFKIGGVYPATMTREAFIRAIDDGGRASAWDVMPWVVRAPSAPGVHPRLLLIDDVPSSIGSFLNLTIDTLWYNTAARNLEPGSFSILRLELTQPFRSDQDVLQTFRQFDAVVWYRSILNQGSPFFSTLLRDRQDGLSGYLDGGGKLLLEGLNLIEGENAPGALRNDWVTRYLGSRGSIRAYRGDTYGDSTADWSINAGFLDTLNNIVYPVILRSSQLTSPDSLRNGTITNGLRGFDVLDTNNVVLWAPDSTLSPRVKRKIPIAVSVPVAASPGGTGRVTVITTSVRHANGFSTAPRFLAKVFKQLGLASP